MCYRKFLENIILPIGDKLLGNTFVHRLKYWRKQIKLNGPQLEKIQLQKLKEVLHHATKNVPYYKQLNIITDNNPHILLKRFPLLYKNTLRNHSKNLITNPLNKKLINMSSSGSSGEQATVYLNKSEISNLRAIQILWWEWAGYAIGDPLIQTGMTTKRGVVKSIKDVLFRTTYIPAFKFSFEKCGLFLNKINNTSHYTLGGYASSLYILSKTAKKNNNRIKFKSVIAWGDKLFDHYKKSIQETFNAKVYETYGSTEGLLIAAQKDTDYMYIMTPHVYLELLDKNGDEVKDGEMGYVVVTSLDSYTMPLIRYYLGDMAIKLPRDEYPEKRALQLPLLKKVIGRDTDIVRTPSGNLMIVHFFTAIFEHIPEIQQFKVIQKNIREIEILYIPSKIFTRNVLNEIQEKIHSYLNENFPIHFIEVNNIPSSPSGKPQIIESYLEKELNG